MSSWRRADPAGTMAAVAAFFILVGVGFTALITYQLVAGSGHWTVNPVVGAASIYGFLAVFTGFAWRMYRTGVYVSDEAVRVSYLWGDKTVPWTDIAEVTKRRAMLRDVPTIRDAIFLRLSDGTLIETPLQRRTDFFSGGVRKNMGPVLEEAEFDATLAKLRQKLGQAS